MYSEVTNAGADKLNKVLEGVRSSWRVEFNFDDELMNIGFKDSVGKADLADIRYILRDLFLFEEKLESYEPIKKALNNAFDSYWVSIIDGSKGLSMIITSQGDYIESNDLEGEVIKTGIMEPFGSYSEAVSKTEDEEYEFNVTWLD